MKITIETINHADQRYDTVGDWQYEPGFTGGEDLRIKVSDMKSEGSEYEFLVGIHELIEAFLCKEFGIKEEDVDKFDLMHQDHPDPGSLPEAPYYRQHLIATIIEQILAHELEISWDTYEEAIEAL